MKIAVLIDSEAHPAEDPALEGKTREIPETVEFHVADTLRKLGHEAVVIPFDADIRNTISQLKVAAPDLVFNLTEHVGGDRQKDAHIAALLELLGIPFTGTGSLGLMLCRDKDLCKRLLSHHRIRVPDFVSLPPGQLRLPRKKTFPLFVKPVSEDGSDGISLGSLVENEEALAQRAQMIHERMKQPAICEEYIQGREIYIGVIGNQQLRALPGREVCFGKSGDGAPAFATARVKHDPKYRKKWGVTYGHADISEEIQERAANISKRAYQLLCVRDYARIDLRVTPENEVVFIEANANPDLTLDDELAESAKKAGIDYQELIKRIVNLALARHGKSA